MAVLKRKDKGHSRRAGPLTRKQCVRPPTSLQRMVPAKHQVE